VSPIISGTGNIRILDVIQSSGRVKQNRMDRHAHSHRSEILREAVPCLSLALLREGRAHSAVRDTSSLAQRKRPLQRYLMFPSIPSSPLTAGQPDPGFPMIFLNHSDEERWYKLQVEAVPIVVLILLAGSPWVRVGRLLACSLSTNITQCLSLLLKVTIMAVCVIAKAVSRWFPTAAARVQARVRSCGICSE
jgi:hypothetical protein